MLAALPALAVDNRAHDLAGQLQESSLDPDACYRVRELRLQKGDLRLYLNAGFLILAKPVNGLRPGAYFASDPVGGDGEMLLLPPNRAERLSLVHFTGAPNLDAHFRSALMAFSDDTAEELEGALKAAGAGPAAKETAAALAMRVTPSLRGAYGNFAVRLIYDLLSGDRQRGVFIVATQGSALGNFDAIRDGELARVSVGQIAERAGHSFFDVWTSFHERHAAPASSTEATVGASGYRIDAEIEPDLSMNVTTRIAIHAKGEVRDAIPFTMSSRMQITGASLDGRPVEVFDQRMETGALAQFQDDGQFLVVPDGVVAPGEHVIEFHHRGDVITRTGDGVYFVAARGTWYPQIDFAPASFEMTFRYPKNLTLVSTGETIDTRTEGAWRISRSKTSAPIRFAGFNLGDYERVKTTRGPFTIELYANRPGPSVKESLSPATPQTPAGREWLPHEFPRSDDNLLALANGAASAFLFMVSEFGPPAIRSIVVSPIPGTFGQGFPGLVYLSTLAYLNPAQRPEAMRSKDQRIFFSDLLEAHEIAHQWWGNLVIPGSPEDDWLMESLANYSALLYLEKRKGAKAVEEVLESYKKDLLKPDEKGRTLESAGPIVWGTRLRSSEAPEAWRVVTYEKGTWIVHMLRLRLGDARFLAMLHAVCERYRKTPLSNEEFRTLCREFAPKSGPDPTLESFFDNWIYGTGIPTLTLRSRIRGTRLTVRVGLGSEEPDLSAWVPLEIDDGAGKRTLHWIETGQDPSELSFPAQGAGARARIDPGWLARVENER